MITGEDLKAMRINAGITQQAMSKKLSCDRRTIHNYELGVSDIPASRFFQWLSYCKLDVGVLLNQIKEIRGEASRNGTSKLLNLISVILLLSPLWGPDIITSLYLFLLLSSIFYGSYIKNANLVQIALCIIIPAALNHIIFKTSLFDFIAPNNNQLVKDLLIYLIQFSINLFTIIILVFRVQIFKKLSKKSTLTHFDGIFHWVYIYTIFIYAIAFIEHLSRHKFDMKHWTIVYDNFEGLIYIAWALCCGTLLTMMITSAKSPTPSVNKTMED